MNLTVPAAPPRGSIAAWSRSRRLSLRSPLGHFSTVLVALLAATCAFVTVNYFQLSRMTDMSSAIDASQQEVVLAYDGLMDADQGLHRYVLDRAQTSRDHLRLGAEHFDQHITSIEQFTAKNRLQDAAAATVVLENAFDRWYQTYALPATQSRSRSVQLAAADRLIDDVQSEMERVDRALVVARQAEVDSVQRQGLLSQALVGAAVLLLAAIGLMVDYKRRREQAASVALLEDRAGALERSNAALQDFAYVASHDLQEPLRMVSSYTQLLARRYQGKLDADADDFIAYAVDGAKRMQGLIRDILEYSRVDASSEALLPVATEDAYRDALANVDGAIVQSGAQVTAAALPRVVGDRRQLAQLFQNLIGNALKYRGEAVPAVRVDAQRHGDMIRFAVHDNGIGIAPEYFERIFRMFQRLHAKSEYSGTGIGLAICKRIVERHGGRMWVESAAGAGSTFFFTLRAAEGTR